MVGMDYFETVVNEFLHEFDSANCSSEKADIKKLVEKYLKKVAADQREKCADQILKVRDLVGRDFADFNDLQNQIIWAEL